MRPRAREAVRFAPFLPSDVEIFSKQKFFAEISPCSGPDDFKKLFSGPEIEKNLLVQFYRASRDQGCKFISPKFHLGEGEVKVKAFHLT